MVHPRPVLVVLSLAGGLLVNQTSRALTEAQALAAVERFISAWNSRDALAFARTLHYPHIRPTPGGGERVHATPEEYAASIDFDAVLATGWRRSEYDSKRVVHLGEHKAHVAGQYTRYREDGSEIWSNQVTYIVTEKEGSIGIQARLAAGLVLESDSMRRESAAAAIEVVEEYMRAFNARDEDAWAGTLHYPHVRIADGDVTVWQTAKDYTDAFDFGRFAERWGWERSEWDAIDAVQVSRDGVNVALTATRYDSRGMPLSTFHTFYLVTRENGRWGIRARSSFAP